MTITVECRCEPSNRCGDLIYVKGPIADDLRSCLRCMLHDPHEHGRDAYGYWKVDRP